MREPNPYVSRSSLAVALEISESTVDEMVRRGVLPRPIKLSSGCVRWRWESVDKSLASLGVASDHDDGNTVDLGVQRAIQAAKGNRRG